MAYTKGTDAAGGGSTVNQQWVNQVAEQKRRQQEEAWAAEQEEKRRQERVEDQARYSKKKTPKVSEKTETTGGVPNLLNPYNQSLGVHATVSDDANPVNRSTNVGQNSEYSSATGTTTAKAEAPKVTNTATNTNTNTSAPAQTPAETYYQNAEVQRQAEEAARQAELKRKAEEEAARALEQRRQYEARQAELARQRDMRLAESAQTVEEAKASAGPQSQEEWLQTPEGQQALANQQAQQANDMALREAALRNDPFANYRIGEPEEQRYDARYPKTTTAPQTTGTANALQEWVNREYPEYTGDQSPAFMERNWYRGRELMQPVYTTAQQNRDNIRAGQRITANRAEDETEFYTGTPENYDDVEPNPLLDTINKIAGFGAKSASGNFEPHGGGYLPRTEAPEAPYDITRYQYYLSQGMSDASAKQAAQRDYVPVSTSSSGDNGRRAGLSDQTLDEIMMGTGGKEYGSLYDLLTNQPIGAEKYTAEDYYDYYGPEAVSGNDSYGLNDGSELLGNVWKSPGAQGSINYYAQLDNALNEKLSELGYSSFDEMPRDDYRRLYEQTVAELNNAGVTEEIETEKVNKYNRDLFDAYQNYGGSSSVDAIEYAIDAGYTPGTPKFNTVVENFLEEKAARNNQKNTPGAISTGGGNTQTPGSSSGASGNPFYNMGEQTSTGNLGTRVEIGNNIESLTDTYVNSGKYKTEDEAEAAAKKAVWDKVYDDYVEKHRKSLEDQYIASGRYKTEAEAKEAAYQSARQLAYQRIYEDLGYRPDPNDPKSYEHYTTGMSKDFIDALEKAGPNGGNNYYTNAGSYNDRYINMLAGGFDRSWEQERLFDELTSELAGNAGRNNPLTNEPYATTPGYSGDDEYPQNGALQAALNGGLTTDQILHFYDANYSDLVIPPEAQRWMADDSTRALLQDVINNRQNLDRLQKEHGTKEELFEALRALLDANPGLKLLYDSGRLNMGDIANQFAKAPVDDTGAVDNPFAGNGGTSNSPHPGYYEWRGQLYPIDQEKAKYYLKNGTYDGWDEGMREYYNTFGTFYGYRPDWKTAGGLNTWKNYSGGGRSYNYSGGNYSGKSSNYSRGGGWSYGGGNNYTNSYYNGNGQGYSYSGNGNAGQSPVNPSAKNQKQNRIYNIMKNWSF